MSFVQLAMPARRRPRGRADHTRRFLDVALSSVGLLCLGPILIAIMLAIVIDGGRPIFFSQIRIGQWGRQFRIYKFRKFRAESRRGSLVTVSDDPRFTRLGCILERMKLDELPQLWNILKGEMSIVGPRPETVDLADCFTESQLRILEHRPGIFGPNQYYFRNEKALYPIGTDPETFYRNVLFPLKADIDAAYFARRTILSDMGWIFRGISAVLGWHAPATSPLDENCPAWLPGRNRRRTIPSAGTEVFETTRSRG